MSHESEAVASATIELLEARLSRLSYLLTGNTDWTGTPSTPEKPTSLDETVSRRLLRLERELEKLCRAVPAVRDLVQLRMCICQPYLKHFPPFSTFFFSFAIPPSCVFASLHGNLPRGQMSIRTHTCATLQTTDSQTSSIPLTPARFQKISVPVLWLRSFSLTQPPFRKRRPV